jgi:hypothetical protein
MAGLILKATFEFSYARFVSPLWSYYGLSLSLNTSKLAESYVFAFVILCTLSLRRCTPSSIILTFVSFFTLMPLLSIYALQDRPRSFTYAAMAMVLIILTLSSLPRIRIPTPEIKSHVFLFLICAPIAIVYVWILSRGGYSYFNLNIAKVYQYRGDVRAQLYVGVFGYMIHWVTHIFQVTLLVWGLYHRRWIVVSIVLLIQTTLFAMLSHKVILFSLPLIIVVFFSVKKQQSVTGLGWLCTALLVVGMAEQSYLGEPHINNLLVQRALALPAYFENEYFELFHRIGHVYWTNSSVLLGMFMPYPFDEQPFYLIGYSAVGSHETWANTGIFGTGFMHAGIIGMLAYGVIYGLWLYVIDCIAVGKVPLAVATGLVLLPTWSVATSSDLTTGFLTGGGAAATVVLWLWSGVARSDLDRSFGQINALAGGFRSGRG